MSLILGKTVPAPGKPDLSEKAERAFRAARERREEEIRAELREKIAAGVEAIGCICWPLDRAGVFDGEFHGSKIYTQPGGAVEDLRFVYEHDPRCPDAIAASIRAGEFG